MGDFTGFGGTVSFDAKITDPALMDRILDAIRGVDSKIGKPTKNKDWMRENGFYKSKGEFGIKALKKDAFALLYIPKGAVVHVGADRTWPQFGLWNNRYTVESMMQAKHRADTAYVVAICELTLDERFETDEVAGMVTSISEIKRNDIFEGVSIQDQNFVYHVGSKLVIEDYDYDHDEECSEGVHYFNNVDTVLMYAYSHSGSYSYIYGNGSAGKKLRKDRVLLENGGKLLAIWMEKNIDTFKNGWGKNIYEEPDSNDDEEKPDRISVNELYETADDAHAAIDKLVEAVQAIKPAERTDLGRYSYRHPARGTRCNCDADDDSGDRPP